MSLLNFIVTGIDLIVTFSQYRSVFYWTFVLVVFTVRAVFSRYSFFVIVTDLYKYIILVLITIIIFLDCYNKSTNNNNKKELRFVVFRFLFLRYHTSQRLLAVIIISIFVHIPLFMFVICYYYFFSACYSDVLLLFFFMIFYNSSLTLSIRSLKMCDFDFSVCADLSLFDRYGLCRLCSIAHFTHYYRC